MLTFQHALSTDWSETVLWTILSPGKRESKMAIVLSSEHENKTETSDLFHSTLLTLEVWWSAV